MRIRADFGVGHPAAEVWTLLSSADGPSCVPGLTVGGSDGGSLAFDVEARRLVFDGTAAAASDRRARTVTIEARGEERSGLGRGRVTVMLRVRDDGLFSIVDVEADLHLTGDLAPMARLVAEAVYRLADGVAECLDTALGSGPPPAPSGPVEEEEPEVHEGWMRRTLRRLGIGAGAT